MAELRFLETGLAENEAIELPARAANLKSVHIFDLESIYAINAALASGRPLLVRGEPGVGKSQLAQAAAIKLGRAFRQYTVDIRTESQDLLWHFDSVSRLAEAQVAGALTLCAGEHPHHTLQKHREAMRAEMAMSKFFHPGCLWWAFDWESAKAQAEKAHHKIEAVEDEAALSNGCVLLIDEIDKAETDVPNGLLEALGAGQFSPPGQTERETAPVVAREPYPLVVITTNEERALPDAFLRRCMVLNLELPREPEKLIALLVKRGGEHFPDVNEAVRQEVARQLLQDRKEAIEGGLRPVPGQAEYIDLLRALSKLCPDAERQMELLEKIKPFALNKHRSGI